jgi:hypothetical protein
MTMHHYILNCAKCPFRKVSVMGNSYCGIAQLSIGRAPAYPSVTKSAHKLTPPPKQCPLRAGTLTVHLRQANGLPYPPPEPKKL